MRSLQIYFALLQSIYRLKEAEIFSSSVDLHPNVTFHISWISVWIPFPRWPKNPSWRVEKYVVLSIPGNGWLSWPLRESNPRSSSKLRGDSIHWHLGRIREPGLSHPCLQSCTSTISIGVNASCLYLVHPLVQPPCAQYFYREEHISDQEKPGGQGPPLVCICIGGLWFIRPWERTLGTVV